VTYLREIYEFLADKLAKNNRAKWVAEEMAVLNAPKTYRVEPSEAWMRIKTRTNSGKFLTVVQALAEFREHHAQTRNIPRNRVFKDDALVELASTKPQNEKDLSRSRLLLREARRGDIAAGILAAVQKGMKADPADLPKSDRSRDKLQVNPALADLLRVLLKAKAEGEGVAQKLIATSSELDAIAAGLRDGDALRGWRREVFGNDALRLCDGEIALAAKGSVVKVVEI
jgi:ribonuclease D